MWPDERRQNSSSGGNNAALVEQLGRDLHLLLIIQRRPEPKTLRDTSHVRDAEGALRMAGH